MKNVQHTRFFIPSLKIIACLVFALFFGNAYASEDIQNSISNMPEIECEENTLEVLGARSFCTGSSTVLTAINYQSYSWNNGATSASIIITEPGSYIVKGTASNGCVSRDTVVVSQLPSPTANITGNLSMCHGNSTVLTTSPSWQVLWSTGSTTDTIVVSTAGNYSVTLTNSYGCTATDEVTVATLPLPVTFIFGNTTICEGEGTTLTIADPSLSCVWNNVQTGPSINVAPTDTTTFFCDVTNTYGCTSRIEKTVNVNPLPDVEIIAPEHICVDSIVTITATGGGSYLWNTEETTSQINVSEGGYYSVGVSLNGCQASDFVFIEEVSNPVIAIDGANAFCMGDSITLAATQGIANYLWSTGETTPIITIHNGGEYYVIGTSAYGCSSEATKMVTLLQTPEFSIQGVNEICQGDTTILTLQDGYTYVWNTNETTPSITVYPEETTEYIVVATSPNGCTAEDTKELIVWNSYHESHVDEVCIDSDYNDYGFELPVQTEVGVFNHVQNLTTVNGCDSIVELELTVNPKPVFNSPIQGPSVVSDTGVYTYTISNVAHVTRYEWRSSNPFWTFVNSTFTESMQLKISKHGEGMITVLAFNNCGYNSTNKEINAIVSIQENEQQENISLYPNPVNDHFMVQTDNNVQISHCIIFDVNGKMVQQESIETQQPLFVNQLQKGQYIVQLFNKQNLLATLKFIKQ